MKKKICLFVLMFCCTGCATDSLQYAGEMMEIPNGESQVATVEYTETDTAIKVLSEIMENL